jgi:hypothetical protein
MAARDAGEGTRVAVNDGRSPGATYQINFSTYAGRPILGQARRAALFFRVLGQLRRRLGFTLHAYVLLPDQARMIVGTHDDDPDTVRLIVQQLKSRCAREINARSGRCGLVWRDGFEAIRIGSPGLIKRRALLLHRNPIIARLAGEEAEWRWSSHRAWSGEGDPPLRIDPPDGILLPSI